MAKKKAAKKATHKKTAKRKPKAKAKRKRVEVPEEALHGKFREAIQAAHDGHYKFDWLRKIISSCGYVKKGDKATKADLVRYGRAVGGVFETGIELVAAQDKELAKDLHEHFKTEMGKLNV